MVNLKLVKTTVRSHPRKGTSGVKRHSRAVSGNRTVPHNVKSNDPRLDGYKDQIEVYKVRLANKKKVYKEYKDKQDSEIKAIKNGWKPTLNLTKKDIKSIEKDIAVTKSQFKQLKKLYRLR